MSIAAEFKLAFSDEKLREIYFGSTRQSGAVGIDRINRISFEKHLADNIQVVSRKILNETYHFSAYREKLILKGKSSYPRQISIPTPRDKIVLRSLTNLLQSAFGQDIQSKLVHAIIHEIKGIIGSNIFNSYIKIDVTNFYPTIKHDLLLRKLESSIDYKPLASLLMKAVKNGTSSISGETVAPNVVGIPQGLSISNLLANIYMLELDQQHELVENYKYFRFVDDILILCNADDLFQIEEVLSNDLMSLGLSVNSSKSKNGPIEDDIRYLGYVKTDKGFSVRKESVEKLKLSLLKSIVQFHYAPNKNYQILEWKLNLRITGCRFEDRKFGWVFFFSQIDDMALLFHLDQYVKRICERYNVDLSKLRLKRFVRTYHEVTTNLTKTNYIPNFDAEGTQSRRSILLKIFKVKGAANLEADEVNEKFRNRILKSIKDLERDIARGS